MQRAEVLRGPQSTHYGRNTEAGTINITTPRPSAEQSGKVSATAGDYNYFKTDLSLSGSANDDGTLFYSLSGSSFQRDGYTHNDYLNEDADDIDHLSGRLKLHWIPADDLEVAFSVYGDRDRDGGYPLTTLENVRSNPYHVEHNQPASHERELLIYDLQTLYHANSFDILSITAVRDWENRDRYDQDFSPAAIATLYDTDSLHGFSQELRLTSRDVSPYSWLAGLYFYRNSENDDDFKYFGADAGMQGATPGLRETSLLGLETWGIAPFGRFTYDLSKNLRSMVGMRFEHQEKEADGSKSYRMDGQPAGSQTTFDAEQDYDEFMPEASLSYDWNADLMSYIRIARGFREGGFNNGESGEDSTYGTERVWNYEASVKSDWLNDHLILNISAFIMEIENQQLIQFKSGGYGFSFKNAGKSKNTGAEIEMVVRPLEWMELRGGFGYVDAEFETFRDPVLGADYSGNAIPFVPDYNYHASVNCHREAFRDIVLSSRLAITGVGDTHWDEANQVTTDAHALFNASVGLAYKGYELSVFGRNLADKQYPSAVYAFPNTTPIAQPGAPRTIGVMLSAEL